VYLRNELIRGRLAPDQYALEITRVRQYLAQQEGRHFSTFLAAWPEPGSAG
jgi:hypothetical protein